MATREDPGGLVSLVDGLVAEGVDRDTVAARVLERTGADRALLVALRDRCLQRVHADRSDVAASLALQGVSRALDRVPRDGAAPFPIRRRGARPE